MRLNASLLALALLLPVAPLSADVLKVPVSEQGQRGIAKPQRGQSMASVESRFGAPLEKIGPVGKPAITRWIYADFIVVFEHSHVIHSVSKRKPSQKPAG